MNPKKDKWKDIVNPKKDKWKDIVLGDSYYPHEQWLGSNCPACGQPVNDHMSQTRNGLCVDCWKFKPKEPKPDALTKPMTREPAQCPECGEDKLFYVDDYICAECREKRDTLIKA